MSALPVSLEDKYTLASGRVYLNGTQALVRLAMIQRERDLAAGLNTAGFISGYRGSPLGGFDQALWKARKHLKDHHIHFTPGVTEELAVTAVWGSQQVGLFAELLSQRFRKACERLGLNKRESAFDLDCTQFRPPSRHGQGSLF